MMTSTISCRSVLLAVGLLVSANPLLAHSVGHHGEAVAEKRVHKVRGLDVDQLITDYSLTGDDELIDTGWRAVGPALDHPTPETWLRAAWLAQAEHQFELAMHYVSRVLKSQPSNPQAWLLKASIADVMGDRPLARRACARLAVTLSPVVATACNARSDRPLAERRTLLARLQRMMPTSLEPNLVAWVRSRAADLAASCGESELAEVLFQRAIDEFPAVQTRAAYADLLIDQHRFDDVLSLLSNAELTPALAVRRVLAAKLAGRDVTAQVASMDAEFRRWMAATDLRHAREMARFYLDVANEPALAHELALANATIQREVEDLELVQRAAEKLAAIDA